MATIEVQLPGLLSDIMGGQLNLQVEAATLGAALRTLAGDHPRLAVHLFDEQGALRPHVLCFYNGTNTRWLEDLDPALQAGDTLLFMQAVSGG